MKKLIFLAMLPLAAISQKSKLEEKKGFRNYIFGTPPESYKNLTLELNEGNSKLYSLHEDHLSVDGFELEYLRLTFFKNKLSVISFETKNHKGDQMLANLKQMYGEPAKKEPQKEKYTWAAKKLHMVYEGHRKSHEATVSFYSDEVY